jgi:hypothetical protein
VTCIHDLTINRLAETQKPVQRPNGVVTRGYLGFFRLYVEGSFVGWAEVCDSYNNVYAVYDTEGALVGKEHTSLNCWERLTRTIRAKLTDQGG